MSNVRISFAHAPASPHQKSPFLRVVKRASTPYWLTALLVAAGIVFALLVGGVLLLCLHKNPLAVYASIVGGAFRSSLAIQSTIRVAIPLCITSIGVALAFRMKFWNIGANGQMLMGALFASYLALNWSGLPRPVLLPLIFVAGMLGGALWGMIPAMFQVRFGTSETLLTLMLNYIALYIVGWLMQGPWRDPTASGFPKIATFAQSTWLDKVAGVQFGWIIALVLIAVSFGYTRYTKQGFEVAVVGESRNTARYAGMNVGLVVLRTMAISGAVCGIAGVTQAMGEAYTLTTGLTDSIVGSVGFTAIIVAWLARLNPFAIVGVTALLSILGKGSSVMQTTFGVSSYVSAVLQGVLLFSVLAFDFFTRYKLVFHTRKSEKTP